MLPARTAKLPGLQPLGMLLLVFRRGVIAVFALTTLQSNDFAHFQIPFAEREPDCSGPHLPIT
jgi:hypothetical protein